MDNQNLTNKNINEFELDRSLAKIIILAAIGIVLAFLFAYFLKLFLLDFTRLDFLLICFILALGFLISFFLNVLFVKSFQNVALITFLESVAMLIVFYDYFSKWAIGAVLGVFLFLIWGNYSGKSELANTLKIRFWRIGKKVMPKAVAALALFIGVVYFEVGGLAQEKFFISSSTFEKMINPVSPVIAQLMPGFDPSLTTEEFIDNLAKNQIEQDPQFESLPAYSKKDLQIQAAKNIEKQLSEFLGISLNPKAKVSEMFYQTLLSRFEKLPAGVKDLIPFGVPLFIFLIIIGFSLPIRWIASVLAFLVYETCLVFGFGSIMSEGTSREIVILK